MIAYLWSLTSVVLLSRCFNFDKTWSLFLLRVHSCITYGTEPEAITNLLTWAIHSLYQCGQTHWTQQKRSAAVERAVRFTAILTYSCSTFSEWAMLSKHFHHEPKALPCSRRQKQSELVKSLNKKNIKQLPPPPNNRISYLCTFWGRTLSSQRDGLVCSWSCSPRTQQTRYSFCCFPAFGWWSNDQTLNRSMCSLSLTQSV